jgi:hypothetical protein
MNSWTDVIKTPPTRYSEPAGMIFVIRCTPDVFTGERINVGVCGVDRGGKRLAKVVTEPGRLQCLYGDLASNVLLLAEAALDAAENGAPSPSPQITFDEPTPFFNSSLEQAVENTFADQVTVALPQRQQRERDEISDAKAQEMVIDALKQAMQLDLGLVANTPQVIINTERGPRSVFIPLQPRSGVGTVRSAHYGAQALKSHLMDSVLDLECAARYRDKRALGLFILRPKRRDALLHASIDRVIDSVMYRCPRSMHLGQSDEAEELAADVARWAEAAT